MYQGFTQNMAMKVNFSDVEFGEYAQSFTFRIKEIFKCDIHHAVLIAEKIQYILNHYKTELDIVGVELDEFPIVGIDYDPGANMGTKRFHISLQNIKDLKNPLGKD